MASGQLTRFLTRLRKSWSRKINLKLYKTTGLFPVRRSPLVISRQLLLLAFVLTMFLAGCAERKRNNPFDRGSGAHAPLRLELYPTDKWVEVKITLTDPIQVSGFRIYRAIDDSTQFRKIAELPRGTTSFLDSTIQWHHWYYYYGTALGAGVESPPSAVTKTYPGPGLNWILTRYNYSIDKYSYDLLHKIRSYATNYPAINWSVDLTNHKIWLANAQFGTVTRFDLNLGYEDLFFEENLQYPIDVVWDPFINKAWVLDDEGNRINLISELGIEKSYSLLQDEYYKLALLPGFGVAVLSKKHLQFVFTKNDTVQSTVFDPDFVGYDLRQKGEQLYVLSVEPTERISHISVFTLPDLTSEKYRINGYFTMLRTTSTPDVFWMVEKISDQKTQLVKLSLQGTRLFQVPGTGLITDMAINPYDSSLVIVKRYEDRVALLQLDGKEIASMSIYDPIRIFIE